jgi:chromosome segregation ATPase
MVLGVANYEARRAAMRSAQEQDEEMRKVMKDCAQQISRLQAERAKDEQAHAQQLQELRDQLAARQGELERERALAAHAARTLKKKHAEETRLAIECHAAETRRREAEARILSASLESAEGTLRDLLDAHAHELSECRGAHARQLESAEAEFEWRRKERSTRHKQRLEAVVASEQAAREALAEQQCAAHGLDRRLRAVSDELRASREALGVESARVALLVAELHVVEASSAAALHERAQLVRSLRAHVSSLDLELGRRAAAHAEEAARHRKTHTRQLETVEERVRALVARKEAELADVRKRLGSALVELEMSRRTLAEVLGN